MTKLKVYDGSNWITIAGTGPTGLTGSTGSTGTYPRSLQFNGDLRGMWLTTPYWKLVDMYRGSNSFPSGITMNSWYVDCNQDNPVTELTAQLKYCDYSSGAFPGGSQTVIDNLNTISGNSQQLNMGSSVLGTGVIPAGKIIYLSLGSNPVDLATTWSVVLNFEAI